MNKLHIFSKCFHPHQYLRILLASAELQIGDLEQMLKKASPLYRAAPRDSRNLNITSSP